MITYFNRYISRHLKPGYVKIVAFLIVSLISGITGYAQPLTGRPLLQYCLDQKNLEYDCPKGWNEDFENEDLGYVYSSGSSTSYRIEPPSKDIMIVFYFPPFPSIEDSIKMVPFDRVFFRGRKVPARNEIYLIHANNQADTLEGRKITYYLPKYAQKILQADHAGTYQLRQQHTFRNKFDKCRIVFLFKNDVGLVELFYFYNDDTKDVDKYIKKTAGMIRFKKE